MLSNKIFCDYLEDMHSKYGSQIRGLVCAVYGQIAYQQDYPIESEAFQLLIEKRKQELVELGHEKETVEKFASKLKSDIGLNLLPKIIKQKNLNSTVAQLNKILGGIASANNYKDIRYYFNWGDMDRRTKIYLDINEKEIVVQTVKGDDNGVVQEILKLEDELINAL